MTNEFLLPDDEEELEDEESTGTEESDEEEDEESEGEEPKGKDTTPKRVRDLQSEKDKAVAEANKLRKELEGLKKPKTDDGKDEGDVPPKLRQWLSAAQDRVRDGLYQAEPRFKKYGVDPALITGESPEDMKASAVQLKRFVARMETGIRNEVLREHGLASSTPDSTPKGPKKSYTDMTADEFQRQVELALRG